MALGWPVSENGPGPGLADLAGGQVQVDEGGVLGRAAAALVQTLAVQAERGGAWPSGWIRGPRQTSGRRWQVFRVDAADLGHPLGCAVAHQAFECLEAAGVRVDVAGVGPAFPQHDVQHAVEQHHVGAGVDAQVQVGDLGGVGAARVDHDDLQRWVGAFGILDAPEQDGVRPGGVAAGDEQALRVVQVVVAGGGRVGAQRGFVAGHRAAHAQARVGVDVVGADQALGQLVEDVIVLGQQLAADIETHGVGAVLVDGRCEAPAGQVQRCVPGQGFGRGAALQPLHRCSRRVCRVTAAVTPSAPAWRPWCTAARNWPDASGSPRTPVIWVPSDSMITPHPTPQ
jgi:hypothetical protein